MDGRRQEADRRKDGVIHAAIANELDIPPRIWVCGSALKENCGCAVAEGSVDSVGMAGDPAAVGHTSEGIARMVVEDVLMG